MEGIKQIRRFICKISQVDKRGWDELNLFPVPIEPTLTIAISVNNKTESEVPTDSDIVATISDHAVTVDSDDENENCVCEVENERPIVTTKVAQRTFKIVTCYYYVYGFDEKLKVSLFSTRKQLQRRLIKLHEANPQN